MLSHIPKAHVRQFASLYFSPSLAKIPRRNAFFICSWQAPPMTTGHPTVNTPVFDERKVQSVSFLIAVKDPKTEACPWWKRSRGAFNTLVMSTRIKRAAEVTGGQFPDIDRRDSTMRHAQASVCRSSGHWTRPIGYDDPQPGPNDPKYRETSPVAAVLDTPQLTTLVNWRSSICELTPFIERVFLF